MSWKLFSDLTAANLEAQRVIALRLCKLSKGDAAASREAQMMVNEKLLASAEAAMTLASGGSVTTVLRRYRTIMRANGKRLSGPHRRGR